MPGSTGGGYLDNVLCIPLYTVLTALNRTHVDYFSLDVEGNELQVLQTIPFDLIDITVMKESQNP